MTDKKKIEVNLEMCSGFFRIPTEDIIYNITVLTSNEPSTTKIVEKIIEVEKIVEVERKAPTSTVKAPSAPAAIIAPPVIDDYYRRIAQKFQQEIAQAVQEAGSAPAGAGGPDPTALHDLAAMATDLKEVLLGLKKSAQASAPVHSGTGSSPINTALEQLLKKIGQAKGLCCSPAVAAPAATPTSTSSTVTRYLFNLDTVFQTIYELCTNETVKTHIKNARAKVDEIFDKEIFYDAISPKVSGYPEDDGFMNVPMSDIYHALGAACSDPAIGNLLVKMDKQQASIFLDQFLLMEVPPHEEVIVAENGGAPQNDPPHPSSAQGDGGVLSILNECQESLDLLILQGADQETAAPADLDDLLNSIDDAISIASSIQYDAQRLATDSGGGSAHPLWLKIKGLAALTEAMLKGKETDASLSFESGLLAAQAAAQRCLQELTPPPQAAAPPPPKPADQAKKTPVAAENFGEASQDDIDRLLEELG